MGSFYERPIKTKDFISLINGVVILLFLGSSYPETKVAGCDFVLLRHNIASNHLAHSFAIFLFSLNVEISQIANGQYEDYPVG